MSTFPARHLFIMLVDDSVADRILFGEILKTIDPAVKYLSLTSGEEAVDYLKAHRDELPDFIFLDVNMPGMNGIETLRALKKLVDTDSVNIYMYSTAHPQSYEETARLLGAQACIQKNMNLDDSLTQITELIKSMHHN